MEQLLLDLVMKFPVAASVVAGVGIARLIFKPLMVFLQAVVEATPSQSDNVLLQKVMESKIYKGWAFVLDYLASIKLPGQK
jgi:hypothetical protein